jgi:hypothetical protein
LRALSTSIAIGLVACGASSTGGPPDLAPAPTYSFLYDHYFADGTPGHCAKSGCHLGTPVVHVWVCGATKETCYAGMVRVGLVNPNDPPSSLIIDPNNSPLSWFNPNGPMPKDSPGPNPAGRDAISAWVLAGALDN